jgi:uncharacterized protein (DUF1778 family)
MTKTTQFWFRLEPKDKRLIERAAKIDRRSTSDFIRLSAVDRAIEVIEAENKRKKGI